MNKTRKTFAEMLDAIAALPAPSPVCFPSRIVCPQVPRPGHPAFVGPHREFTMAGFFDPRPDAKLD